MKMNNYIRKNSLVWDPRTRTWLTSSLDTRCCRIFLVRGICMLNYAFLINVPWHNIEPIPSLLPIVRFISRSCFFTQCVHVLRAQMLLSQSPNLLPLWKRPNRVFCFTYRQLFTTLFPTFTEKFFFLTTLLTKVMFHYLFISESSNSCYTN